MMSFFRKEVLLVTIGEVGHFWLSRNHSESVLFKRYGMFRPHGSGAAEIG